MTPDDNSFTNKNCQDKHLKYNNKYVGNEVYWGLGIEFETYLEFENKIPVTKSIFLNNHKRERYSVDYYSNYYSNNIKINELEYPNKTNHLQSAFQTYEIPKSLPLLINAHSFTNTDRENQPRTLYTKTGGFNPKFNGKTLFDNILTVADLSNCYGIEWLFDGDTIEFTTLNFYKAKLPDVLTELRTYKTNFITALQEYQERTDVFKSYGKIQLMTQNHPFSVHLTNLNNIAMFNNGTLHYNLTLPTELDKKCCISNKDDFIKKHCLAIRLIQWFEPLLISVYNTPDPFAKDGENPHFSNCSQRCAVSRYIGIGTYDTNSMQTGKILTVPTSRFSHYENWWYANYHKQSAYTPLSDVGLDINFNKHYNHGIEIRFLDYISDTELMSESFEFIIYLMDFLLEKIEKGGIEVENPIYHDVWNGIVLTSITFGHNAVLTDVEKQVYENLLGVQIKSHNIYLIYYEILHFLHMRYNNISFVTTENKYRIEPIGLFSKRTLTTKIMDMDEKMVMKENDGLKPVLEITDMDDNNDTYREPDKPNCCQKIMSLFGFNSTDRP